MELPTVVIVGEQSTVTSRAVCVVVQEDSEELDELDDESEFDELESEFDELELLSSSVRSSVSDVRSSSASSMPSTLSELMLSVMSSKSSSMQDNLLMTSPIAPSKPLFIFLEPHPEDEESPPRSEMRSSISLLTGLILSSVSSLRGSGFFFQELIAPIKTTTSEETEDTLEVACWLAMVVVTGGRVIGDEYDPPEMIGTG